MSLSVYYIDAFTDKVFGGNPAAVVPLKKWLADETMQKIAMENNLSETVFFVPEGDGFGIRWFTPVTEINLCGHATLASAYVLWSILAYPYPQIHFYSKSGKLYVDRDGDRIRMQFPVIPCSSVSVIPEVLLAYSDVIEEVFSTHNKYMIVMDSVESLLEIKASLFNIYNIDKDIIMTSIGRKNVDFVSRFFAPHVGISEDPVTGSAHCVLIPYWAARLGKNTLFAEQLSPRKGKLWCTYHQEYVRMGGYACLYMKGEITEEVLR